jgi:hypothetical protein
MQHYGFPTPHTGLDGVALYFAFEYEDETPSSCIWLLNPFGLNKAAVGSPTPTSSVMRLWRFLVLRKFFFGPQFSELSIFYRKR